MAALLWARRRQSPFLDPEPPANQRPSGTHERRTEPRSSRGIQEEQRQRAARSEPSALSLFLPLIRGQSLTSVSLALSLLFGKTSPEVLHVIPRGRFP